MGQFSIHLKELAALVGAAAHDGVVESATSTTLTDTFLVHDADIWNGYRVYIYDGTGEGQERIITDFGSTVVTVSPAWATNPDATSKFIILHKTWTMEMLRQSFILALRRRRKQMLRPKVDETVTLVDGTLEYTVPSGFVTISDIYRENTVGSSLYNVKLDQSLWYIAKKSTAKIVFNELLDDNNSFIVDGATLRIVGQQYETEPTADTSTINVGTGSLLLLAASIAHMNFSPLDTTHRFQVAQALRQEYESAKWDDISPPYQGSRFVEDV